MDIEKLKMIIEALGAATDGAREIAWAWIWWNVFTTILSYGLGFTGVLCAYKIICKMVGHSKNWTTLERIWSSVIDTKIYGSWLTAQEERRLLDSIENLKK